jgi:hypothetical protein
MTTSREQQPDRTPDTEVARLRQENAQLRQAIDSHAVVDQAIGVLIATYRIPAAAGFEVLREASQHTNIKLRTVAEALIGCASGRAKPEPLGRELDAAVQRRSRQQDAPDRPGWEVRGSGPARWWDGSQ